MVLVLQIIRNLILLATAVLLIWIGGFLAFAAWIANMKPETAEAPTDAVIVLTGGARRINTGLDLLAEGHAQQLFISGVNEAVSLGDIMDLWTADPDHRRSATCCIVLDHNARNTVENAREAGDWVHHENIGTVRLVTSSYHMPRAWLEFRNVMPELDIRPHPVVSLERDLRSGLFWRLAFNEYHKTLLTLIRVRLGDDNGTTHAEYMTTTEEE